MKLNSTERAMIKKAPALYSQDGKKGDAICYGHYFGGPYDFWVLEVSQQGDDYMMYGIANLYEMEYGYQSLAELKSIHLGVNEIEIEKGWKPKPLKEIRHVRELMEDMWQARM